MKRRYTSDNTSNSLGYLDVFQMIFIVLKATNLIDWSWWKVLTPLWIGLAIMVVNVAAISISRARENTKRKK